MVILGLLSLIQIIILPGFIFLRLTSFKGTVIQRLVYSFAISVLFNGTLVFFSTLLGIFNQITVYSVFILETIAFLVLERKNIFQVFNKPLSEPLQKLLIYIFEIHLDFRQSIETRLQKKYRIVSEIISWGLTIGILLCVSYILLKTIFHFNIFWYGDAILSWNRWALDWYNNTIPQMTSRYPQILPSNWALSYVMMGYPLQYFAKTLMPFFTLGILMLFVDLGKKTRNPAYYLSVLFFMFIIMKRYYWGISDGIADISACFLGFTAFSILLHIYENDTSDKNPPLYIAAIAAAGALGLKQTGISFLLSFPILALVLLRKRKNAIQPKEWFLAGVAFALTLIISVLPFYILKELQIQQGKDISEITLIVQGAMGNLPFVDRFTQAFESLKSAIYGKVLGILVLFLLMIVSLKHKQNRWFFFIYALPFTICWTLVASYDARDFIPFFPIWSFLAAVGLMDIIQGPLLQKQPTISISSNPVNVPLWIKKLKIGWVVVALLISVVFLNMRFTSETLKNKQDESLKTMAFPQVNDLLYDYLNKKGLHGYIMTEYFYTDYLPGLEQYSKRVRFRIWYPAEANEIWDTYQTLMKDTNNNYLLLEWPLVAPRIQQDIENRISLGKIKLIFSATRFDVRFLEIIRKNK